MSEEEHEQNRLKFVAGRDGSDAAIAFARQGIEQYGSAIREAEAGGNQYGNVYRSGLQASIRVYRIFLGES